MILSHLGQQYYYAPLSEGPRDIRIALHCCVRLATPRVRSADKLHVDACLLGPAFSTVVREF